MYQVGDRVIYTKTKRSTSPGPRAKDITPAPHGESYTYKVDKFWRVAEVRDDGKLLLVTRRGKAHVVEADNPRLRHAHWWERWLYSQHFPSASAPANGNDHDSSDRQSAQRHSVG